MYFKMLEFAAVLIDARSTGSASIFITQAQTADFLMLDEWLRDPFPEPNARVILDLTRIIHKPAPPGRLRY
jgi:hypothetical protein